MITGRFGDTTGRPYVEATVSLPRLKIEFPVSFLVDTGADISLINTVDVVQAAIPFDALKYDKRLPRISGIGGARSFFMEPAVLYFADIDPPTLHGFEVSLAISDKQEAEDDIRSLLGRDVLDKMRMNYDPGNGVLQLTAVAPDRSDSVNVIVPPMDVKSAN